VRPVSAATFSAAAKFSGLNRIVAVRERVVIFAMFIP
jgi:hypothetical protein